VKKGKKESREIIPLFTVSHQPGRKKRTPGGMLVRQGKAKLKNIQQERGRYRVTMFHVHHGNHLITPLETANEKSTQTILLPKVSQSISLDIENISHNAG
jgi:hypothetical protein